MYKSGKMLVIAGSVSIIGVTSFIQQAQADVSQKQWGSSGHGSRSIEFGCDYV